MNKRMLLPLLKSLSTFCTSSTIKKEQVGSRKKKKELKFERFEFSNVLVLSLVVEKSPPEGSRYSAAQFE